MSEEKKKRERQAQYESAAHMNIEKSELKKKSKRETSLSGEKRMSNKNEVENNNNEKTPRKNRFLQEDGKSNSDFYDNNLNNHNSINYNNINNNYSNNTNNNNNNNSNFEHFKDKENFYLNKNLTLDQINERQIKKMKENEFTSTYSINALKNKFKGADEKEMNSFQSKNI